MIPCVRAGVMPDGPARVKWGAKLQRPPLSSVVCASTAVSMCAKELERSSGPRRCLKSAEYLAELAFDKVILRGNCVFRMRKPNWKSVCCTLAHSNARSVLTPFALPAV